MNRVNFNYTFSDVEWSWLPKCFAITIFTQLPKHEKVEICLTGRHSKEKAAILCYFFAILDSSGQSFGEILPHKHNDLSIEILCGDFLKHQL